ncbi:MAG: aspartate carbamoyltransferase [Planctomycetota bacterium]|nr:MAG: aspartate carbamoyltransferase [Planctomycetota bacterium]
MDIDPGFLEFESRLSRPLNLKIPDLQHGGRLRHVLFASQFNLPLLDRLGKVADRIRTIAKSREGHRFLNSLLSHKRAMLYFSQPSTRTFLSFSAACQILGIACNEVRDPATSSESKGESPLDSIRMFSSYFDLVIMRSPVSQFAECCAYMMNELEQEDRRSVPIVNAGSGKDEHPTQALLDMYTIQRAFEFRHERDSSQWSKYDEMRSKYPNVRRGIDHKIIGFCGDLRRGRTMRSLAQLLALHQEMTMIFIAPKHPSLSMPDDLKQLLMDSGVRVLEADSFETPIGGVPVIEQLDCLYMTRIQTEHNSAQDKVDFAAIDFTNYKLTRSLVQRMKEYAAILHPFPRDKEFGEIPPAVDRDPRAHYFRQARNGMWARAALLAHIFDVDGAISDYYEDYTKRKPLAPP